MSVAMQSKPRLFTILLAGGALCVLAGQLHASGTLVPKVAPAVQTQPAVNASSTPSPASPSPASTTQKDRTRSRPAPGSLTGAIEARGFWFGGSAAPAETREPIRVEAPEWTAKELHAIATQPGGPEIWAVVDGSVVNIRSAPGIDAARVGSLERGVRVRVIERRDAWARIENPETRQTGWMHRDFLKAAGPDVAG